ncbi:MAG: large conductance mechanosensitive channel protein MscL [Leeuwenhoekiella sp.]
MKFTLFREFKEFAVKGNMIDIAVGVIIGAAFNKVIDALVKEVFMPPLSLLTDGISWQNKEWVLRDEVLVNGEATVEKVAVGYGHLMEAGLDFLIIGFSVFVVVKFMNSLKKKADDPKNPQAPTPKDLELLDRIGDLLEQQNGMLAGQNAKGKA